MPEPGLRVGKHCSCLGRNGDGGAATNNNIFNISKSLTLWNFCDRLSHRRKTDGQILPLDSCPSSGEYAIAKTINFNDLIDEFASVKAIKVTL
jgi:hypothetical protein